ncbi:CRAL TRIO domain protein [Seminavis robusta]|uniref:CRAL TRIO domain protein n=1 Tax=Seminavis robusta TaxID=568900 RepID=A0A9N8HLL6_9STRA|nr:CRAL TRIO domain protein [Seminavis robusta]|eukprot:Sro926_g221040.1 CRAL TRIO domain protein (317) ;mRNA; f:23184-24134
MCRPDETEEGVIPEDDHLQYMLGCLSDEELEIAARTSYQYAKEGGNEEVRDKHAMAMARRYLKSKKNVDKALDYMKATIQFRSDMKIDRLRTVFDGKDLGHHQDEEKTPTSDDEDVDSNPNVDTEKFASQLESRLSSKKNFVMGYDKEGRATFHFIPRCTQHHDLEWTMLESIYTMERAIACSERRRGDGSINAMIDCAGLKQWAHTPPMNVGKYFLKTLRRHYIGHIQKIFILDAPLGFAWLWKILSPFVGTATRNKIVFLSGTDEKMSYLSGPQCYYEESEAAPWMLESGKKDRELDMQEYLYRTPFDRAFDDA